MSPEALSTDALAGGLLSSAMAWTLASQAALLCALGLWVIYLRVSRRVGIGDGGDRTLKRAIRVHANWTEWVPMALICMIAADLRGADPQVIGGLGLTLMAARLLHISALSRHVSWSPLRSGGVALTMFVMIAGAVLAVQGG